MNFILVCLLLVGSAFSIPTINNRTTTNATIKNSTSLLNSSAPLVSSDAPPLLNYTLGTVFNYPFFQFDTQNHSTQNKTYPTYNILVGLIYMVQYLKSTQGVSNISSLSLGTLAKLKYTSDYGWGAPQDCDLVLFDPKLVTKVYKTNIPQNYPNWVSFLVLQQLATNLIPQLGIADGNIYSDAFLAGVKSLKFTFDVNNPLHNEILDSAAFISSIEFLTTVYDNID